MKLRAFIKLLCDKHIVIDTEEKGLVLAHFIDRYWPSSFLANTDILDKLTTIDPNNWTYETWSKIKTNKPQGNVTHPEFLKRQDLILSKSFGMMLARMVPAQQKSRRGKGTPIPYRPNICDEDRKAILNFKTSTKTSHRYNIDRYSSPTMSISSNGLISVDSRYSKLHEDYDDK